MTNTDTAQQQLAELRRQYWRLYWQRAAMLEALAGKTTPELQSQLVAISETTDAEIDAKGQIISAWIRAEGNPPPPVGDCRKIVTLQDGDDMIWVGIRAYNHADRCWISGGREEGATVTAWQHLPEPYRPGTDALAGEQDGGKGK